MGSKRSDIMRNERGGESGAIPTITYSSRSVIEKRRRDDLNQALDELAKLVNLPTFRSGKVDKNRILEEVIKELSRHKERDAAKSSVDESSTNGSSSILFEAIDGFVMKLNLNGRILAVSPNITKFLGYAEGDVVGLFIKNFIHPNDRNIFAPSLPSIPLGFNGELMPQTKNHTFNCRFSVKSPNGSPIFKLKQVSCDGKVYENNPQGMDSNFKLYFVRARPNVTIYDNSISQFSMRLDTTGKIKAISTSNLSFTYTNYLNTDLIGKMITDLCHPQDLSGVYNHLMDSLRIGEGTSPLYRLMVAPNTVLHIQTKSKLFKMEQGTELQTAVRKVNNDFLMTTNTIIRLQVEPPQPSAILCHSTATSTAGAGQAPVPSNDEQYFSQQSPISMESSSEASNAFVPRYVESNAYAQGYVESNGFVPRYVDANAFDPGYAGQNVFVSGYVEPNAFAPEYMENSMESQPTECLEHSSEDREYLNSVMELELANVLEDLMEIQHTLSQCGVDST